MVEHGDAQLRSVRAAELLRRARELRLAEATALIPPRPNRVEADRDDAVAAVDGLRRLPQPLELLVGAGEARRERVRDVVVAGDTEQRSPEATQQLRGRVVLLRLSAVREVAAGDDELRLEALDNRA